MNGLGDSTQPRTGHDGKRDLRDHIPGMTRHKRRINQNGELIVTSQRFRDRGRNVADCLTKLQLQTCLLIEQ